MKSGIYIILNLIDYKVYTGQSVNVTRRLSSHKYKLKRNSHHNDHLQSAYNKYGGDNFSFQVLEFCELDLLDERERFWIAEFNSMNKKFGYNRECGGSLNKSTSEETRRKMSDSHKKEVTQEMIDDILNGIGQVQFTQKYNYSNEIWYRIKREWRRAS